MTGIFACTHRGTPIFSYEFLLEDEGVVDVTWAEGVKMAVDAFRKARPGLSLWDIDIKINARS